MNGPGKRRRSRRLRKKLHIGEFAQLGFRFAADIHPHYSATHIAATVEVLLEEVIEARGLAMGGWLQGGYVQGTRRASASDADRLALQAWLSARPEVEACYVEPLSDD